MKTQLLSSLRLSLALLTLSVAAQAQTDPTPTFQAACYPIQHSMKIRLFVENPTNQPVRVQIRDKQGRIQYQETYVQLTKFHRAFNLGELGDGTYTIAVTQGKLGWSQEVIVETISARNLALNLSPAPEPAFKATPILARKP